MKSINPKSITDWHLLHQLYALVVFIASSSVKSGRHLSGDTGLSRNHVIVKIHTVDQEVWCQYCNYFPGCRTAVVSSVLGHMNINIIYCLVMTPVHRESKKTRHQTLSHKFTNYYPIFKFFFTSWLGSKFSTNLCLNIPPRFKHVATLPCEIWMSENGIILKYVLQLMTNHKVV